MLMVHYINESINQSMNQCINPLINIRHRLFERLLEHGDIGLAQLSYSSHTERMKTPCPTRVNAGHAHEVAEFTADT